MKNSEGVATTIGVSALLVSHGSANDWGGLGVAPNGAKLLKGGLQLYQSPNLLSYKTLFKLTGLNTSHRYELALASQYNTDDRSTSYRVGLVQDTVANGGAATDWSNGLNYAVLDNLIPNSAGEIHVQCMVNSDWAPLNGWQLLDKGVRTAGANSYTTIDTCSFGALGAATITDSNITLTVPYGTALGALTPDLGRRRRRDDLAKHPAELRQPGDLPGHRRERRELSGLYGHHHGRTQYHLHQHGAGGHRRRDRRGNPQHRHAGRGQPLRHASDGIVAAITLANGLIFGTDWSHTIPRRA